MPADWRLRAIDAVRCAHHILPVALNLHRFAFGTAGDGGAATIRALTNPPTNCRSPSTTFQAILGCFGAAETVAVEHRLGQAEMKDLRKFLSRIAAVVRGPMQGKESALLRLLDPAESVEPAELFQV